MKKHLLPVFLLMTGALFAQTSGHMQGARGHLFIHGGAMLNSQYDRFIQLAGGSNAKILVIPFAADRPQERALEIVNIMTNRRATNVDYVFFNNGEADLPQNLAKLDGVTGVWFVGGSQTQLRNMLIGTVFLERIKEIYRNGGTIGGTSAGAAVMSEVMIAGDTNQGFGFIDFAIIHQHFSQMNRESALHTAVLEHSLPGIGIDEVTAVIYSAAANTFEVMGNNSVFVYTPPLSTAMPGSSVNIQRYNSGDSFSINVQRQSLLPPGIRYEDFLGTYTMHYSISPSNPAHTRSLTITLVQAVHGRSYYLRGLLPAADEALGNIEVLFDPYNGIYIRGNRHLFSRPDPNRDLQFWIVSMNNSGNNSRLNLFGQGLRGADYELTNGRLSFNTRDNRASSNLVGFLFRIYPNGVNENTTNVNHRGGDHRFYYPRFVKQ